MNGLPICVLGAGPAGSAVAIELARRGLPVHLVDRAAFPRDKVCGGCLDTRALRSLEHLGVDVADQLRPLERVHLLHGSRLTELVIGGGGAVRRSLLDERLMQAAAVAGAAVELSMKAEIVDQDDRSVRLRLTSGGRARIETAHIVVDARGLAPRPLATGRRSRRALIGLGAIVPAGDERPRQAADLQPGTITLAITPEGYLGTTRLDDHTVDIAAAVDPGFLRRTGSAPAVIAKMAASAGQSLPPAAGTVRWKGTPPLSSPRRRAANGRILRVGDAAGYREPFTGQGIGWALDAGIAAAHLISAHLDRTDRIAARWTRMTARFHLQRQAACRLVGWGLESDWRTSFALRALGRHRWLQRPAAAAVGRTLEQLQ